MPMHLWIENRTLRQQVGREKMLARSKHFATAVLQTYFHLPLQDEHPLRMAADMELALKTHGAFTQLHTLRWHPLAQTGFFAALV